MTSAARTVIISAAAPAWLGSPAFPTPTWPAAEPAEVLDYYADVTAPLADVADTLASLSVAAAPSGEGELVISSVSATDAIIEIWMTGGVPGRRYVVEITGQTTDERTFVWTVALPIDSAFAVYPVPDPPSSGFGTPVTWAATP